jgi:hypothetical protein
MDSATMVPRPIAVSPMDLARRVRTEMIAPFVEPWMEELRRVTGGRINRDDPRTLPQGA